MIESTGAGEGFLNCLNDKGKVTSTSVEDVLVRSGTERKFMLNSEACAERTKGEL